MGGKLGTAPVRVAIDDPSITVEIPEKGDTIKMTVAADARPGLHWLRFYNAEGAASPRPFFVSTVAEVEEKEPNNAVSQATGVDALPAVVNGVLSRSNEVDTFRITLKKGQTLIAALDAHGPLGAPMDGVLQFVSANQFVIDQNDDERGFDPQLTCVAPADGEYCVRVFAFPAAPNSSIRFAGGADYVYRLTLTTGPHADHAVPLAVQRDTPAEVAIAGWNFDEPLVLPVSPQSDLGPWDLVDERFTGSCRLQIVDSEVALETEPNNDAPKQTFEGPIVVCGRLEQQGDVDRYLLRAKKGQKLLLRVEGRSIGSPVDPVLKVTDAAGKVLKRVDDPSRNVFDPEFDFTAPADGDYTVEVADLHDRGGIRFSYLLKFVEHRPDFALTIEKSEFVLPTDKTVEIPVKIERGFGFDGVIDIVASGLPAGVTADVVRSEPKEKSAKAVTLTLKRSAGAEPFGGPIRVLGQVQAKEADGAEKSEAPKAAAPAGSVPPPTLPTEVTLLERAARATISGFDATTPDVWLTVVGDPKKAEAEKKK